MAVGLLALLDDLASLLDDVSVMTRVAVKQTAGVIGDDLALNANQVTGMRPNRELPVVWAVAKGALLNKVILVPTALAISAVLPAAITPLLMIGGAYLCYEGFEKLWHKLRHKDEEDAEHAELARVASDPAVDLVKFERDKIRGAVRTDFILSAEIIVIALGTMQGRSLAEQALALALVGLGMNVLVYGVVGGLVKIDDLGLRLLKGPRERTTLRRLGVVILNWAPRLMMTLSVVGTAAMFMVGGGIISHGIPAIEHTMEPLLESLGAFGGIAGVLLQAIVGIVAGALLVGVLSLVPRRRSHEAAAG